MDKNQAPVPANTFPLIFRRGWRADLLFWFVYGLFWHFIFAPSIMIENLMISVILTFWQAVASYTLLRFFLEPRRNGAISIMRYALGIVAMTLFFSALSGSCVYAFFIGLLPPGATDGFLEYWVGAIVGGMTMAVAVTGGIYLFGHRRDQEKRQAELEKARTDAELAFLRGQLNPHFLFNALNSIYVLIPRNPEDAQMALGGFSDLLRYQLYRSQEDVVPLREEIAQIRKFSDLSRLRLEEDFVFALQTPKQLSDERIPPMLLVPLIENAIKYSPKQGGKVTVDKDASGIGLKNIRRRLNLIFPENHHFETTEKDGHFTVNLEIPLS